MNEIVVDVWGDYALFTRSETKVERITYDVPTPSACRGILSSIYFKPKEFHYQITSIEVMQPIRHINIKRNEIYTKIDRKTHMPIVTNTVITQRNSIFLKDVYYRIHAKIVPHKADRYIPEISLYKQFEQRMNAGKCFEQPFLGTRECMAFFGPPDYTIKPIQESRDLGIMLYDIFDIRTAIPLDTYNNTGSISPSYYHARMQDGIIMVPDYESDEVLKEVS